MLGRKNCHLHRSPEASSSRRRTGKEKSASRMFREKQNCRATPVVSPELPPNNNQKSPLERMNLSISIWSNPNIASTCPEKPRVSKKSIFNPGATHELPLVVIKIQIHTYGKAGKTDFVFDLNTVTHKLILLLYEPNCTSTAKEKDGIIKFNSGIQYEEQRDKS